MNASQSNCSSFSLFISNRAIRLLWHKSVFFFFSFLLFFFGILLLLRYLSVAFGRSIGLGDIDYRQAEQIVPFAKTQYMRLSLCAIKLVLQMLQTNVSVETGVSTLFFSPSHTLCLSLPSLPLFALGLESSTREYGDVEVKSIDYLGHWTAY